MKLLHVLVVLITLGLSSTSWAALIQITDGLEHLYSPTDTFGQDIVLVEEDIYSFGFSFTDVTHTFGLVIDAPQDLVGRIDWGVTSGLDATGQGFASGVLFAGDSIEITIGGVDSSTPQNLHTEFISLLYDDLNPNTVNNSIELSSVPVPPSLLLLISGLLGLTIFPRRKKRLLKNGSISAEKLNTN